MKTPSTGLAIRSGEVGETLLPAALTAIAFLGYFAVPPGIPRAVLVIPAVLWIPGRCVIGRLGLARLAGVWAAPLSALLSIVLLIATALAVYLVFGHVRLGTLPLWLSLVAVLSTVDPASFARRRGGSADSADAVSQAYGLTKFGAVFGVGVVASAAIVAGVYHALPAQNQPGYLEFAFSGSYAHVSGVVSTKPGSVLDIPLSVSASQEDISGLDVVVAVDGAPVPGLAAVPINQTGGEQGSVEIHLPVTARCLGRYSFTLEQGTKTLRELDLYVTTTGMATCHGK